MLEEEVIRSIFVSLIRLSDVRQKTSCSHCRPRVWSDVLTTRGFVMRASYSALLLIVLVTLAAAGCSTPGAQGTTPPAGGGGGRGGGGAGGPVPVTVGRAVQKPVPLTIEVIGIKGARSFSPNPESIAAGQMVVWHNGDIETHHVVLDDRSVDTGNLRPGAWSAPMPIGTAGPYHCTIHPSMVGTISR